MRGYDLLTQIKKFLAFGSAPPSLKRLVNIVVTSEPSDYLARALYEYIYDYSL